MADLLARRVRLAQRVALLKHLTERPPRDTNREASVRAGYAGRLVPVGWTRTAVDSWMDALIDVSVRQQDAVPVAYQGGPGSWSETSLRLALPVARGVGRPTFAEAWRATLHGDAIAAWLPVRNTLLGPFPEVLEILEHAVVWMEADLPVRHALLASKGTVLGDVRRVLGHPKALAQCRRSLAAIVPRARLDEVVDGADALSRIRPAAGEAVVGSRTLARIHGLAVLDDDLSDDPANQTTFRLVVPPGPL